MFASKHFQYTLIVLVSLWMTSQAWALSCAQDLNGNGDIEVATEAATCQTTSQGELCPIGAASCVNQPVCPLGNYSCTNGQCTQPGSCSEVTSTDTTTVPVTTTTYQCPIITNNTYTDLSSCASACQTQAWGIYSYLLPKGEGIPPILYTILSSPDGGCTGSSTTTDTTQTTTITEYQCDQTGTKYATQSACQSACTQTASCTEGAPECPLDPNLACMDSGGGNYQCSPNQCLDMTQESAATNPDVTTTDIDTSMPDNSGPRDANGNCLGSISIFAGRGMNCKKAGLRSGFHDCCDNGGSGVISDSLGTDVGTQIAQQGLSVMGHFAYTAYTAYGALSGGSLTAAEAAATATQYAYNSVLLNPATWYLGAASMVVSYLIAEKCSQMDMETAMAVGSGFCHYVGKYCSEKWTFIGCVQKKASYCCFNSMLGRIIQEQGRPQLRSFTSSPTGTWGIPEQPLCRGMSPEEFQTLDFSSMDLSEYFGYVTQVATDTINAGVPQANVQNAVTNFYNGIR